MNELSALHQFLRRELPDAVSMKLDAPESRDLASWLDIEFEGQWVAVEWKPTIGFGISMIEGIEEDPKKGLFEGPDEFFTDLSQAQEHILSLFHTIAAESRPIRVARG
jgi:hypothetical protein